MNYVVYIIVSWGGGYLLGRFFGERLWVLNNSDKYTYGQKVLLVIICCLSSFVLSAAWGLKWMELLL